MKTRRSRKSFDPPPPPGASRRGAGRRAAAGRNRGSSTSSSAVKQQEGVGVNGGGGSSELVVKSGGGANGNRKVLNLSGSFWEPSTLPKMPAGNETITISDSEESELEEGEIKEVSETEPEAEAEAEVEVGRASDKLGLGVLRGDDKAKDNNKKGSCWFSRNNCFVGINDEVKGSAVLTSSPKQAQDEDIQVIDVADVTVTQQATEDQEVEVDNDNPFRIGGAAVTVSRRKKLRGGNRNSNSRSNSRASSASSKSPGKKKRKHKGKNKNKKETVTVNSKSDIGEIEGRNQNLSLFNNPGSPPGPMSPTSTSSPAATAAQAQTPPVQQKRLVQVRAYLDILQAERRRSSEDIRTNNSNTTFSPSPIATATATTATGTVTSTTTSTPSSSQEPYLRFLTSTPASPDTQPTPPRKEPVHIPFHDNDNDALEETILVPTLTFRNRNPSPPMMTPSPLAFSTHQFQQYRPSPYSNNKDDEDDDVMIVTPSKQEEEVPLINLADESESHPDYCGEDSNDGVEVVAVVASGSGLNNKRKRSSIGRMQGAIKKAKFTVARRASLTSSNNVNVLNTAGNLNLSKKQRRKELKRLNREAKKQRQRNYHRLPVWNPNYGRQNYAAFNMNRSREFNRQVILRPTGNPGDPHGQVDSMNIRVPNPLFFGGGLVPPPPFNIRAGFQRPPPPLIPRVPGPIPLQDVDLRGMWSQNQGQPQPGQSGKAQQQIAPGSNVMNVGEAVSRPKGTLRPIVIDGSNIAIGHGSNIPGPGPSPGPKFSAKGIKICVDYFLRRGHKEIVVFVPRYRLKKTECLDPELLEEMEKNGYVKFTPSREAGGVRIASYDDLFVVQYAHETGGIIISNDNFRDLYDRNPEFRETIRFRILQYTWITLETLMFPADPLGRNGPTLDNFLTF